MKKSKIIFAAALILLLALALLFSTTNVFAKKDLPKPHSHVKGTITTLDIDAGTVSIQDKKSDELVTVTVDEATHIHKDNREPATLQDLAVGDRAHARYNQETLIAKRIHAKSPKQKSEKAHGKITAIDGQNVTLDSKRGDPVTVIVTDATEVTRNRADATLDDLVVGDRARARYDATTMEASKLKAKSK